MAHLCVCVRERERERERKNREKLPAWSLQLENRKLHQEVSKSLRSSIKSCKAIVHCLAHVTRLILLRKSPKLVGV
ncbi:unnamed protein product, partial [Sphagnum jensenii]